MDRYGDAHTAADTGSEFIHSHATTLDFIKPYWRVPMNDIIAIYRDLGISVKKTQMMACLTRGFTGVNAVKLAGSNLYAVGASKVFLFVFTIEISLRFSTKIWNRIIMGGCKMPQLGHRCAG
jgi:hypothetical protein